MKNHPPDFEVHKRLVLTLIITALLVIILASGFTLLGPLSSEVSETPPDSTTSKSNSEEIISELPENVTYLGILVSKSLSRTYRRLKFREATFLVPSDIDLKLELMKASDASERAGIKLMEDLVILKGLLGKAITGNYTPFFEESLRMAEEGKGLSFLEKVLEWEKQGLSVHEMMNITIQEIENLTARLIDYAYKEGVLEILSNAPYPPPYPIDTGIDLKLELMKASDASERAGIKLMEDLVILKGLLGKAITGNYTPFFEESLRMAEEGKGLSFLEKVLEWEKQGLSVHEMMNITIQEIENLTMMDLGDYAYKEGVLEILYLSSLNKTYVLTSCDPPYSAPYGWTYFHNFMKCKVWIGCYSSDWPISSKMIGEWRTTIFTTDIGFYWKISKHWYPSLKSIEIKWIHRAWAYDPYRWSHNLIWEVDKSERYGIRWRTARYKTTNPSSGNYYVVNYYGLICCSPPRYYCNKHCGSCFCCDKDKAQHFVYRQP